MIKKKRPPKTIKEKKFIKEYIKTGNATEAASRVYDVSSKNSAAVIGNENLRKLNIVDVMEKAGITDEKLTKKLDEGLEASKEGGTDYITRHRYLETALRLKGYNAGDAPNINIQNNVIALPTKRTMDTPPETD